MNNIAQNVKSVGIVGDGDDVELIEDFERVFQISFSNVEAENIRTLGDAFEVICSKLPKAQNQQGKCRTAMAYYRLNRSICYIGKINLDLHVKPTPNFNPKSYHKHLEDSTGLNLHFLTRESLWATVLFWLQFVCWGIAIGAVFFVGWYAAIFMIIIALIAHMLWKLANQYDQRVWLFDGTLGDLSQQASSVNIGNLISLGGSWKDSDIWETMTTIIHEVTCFPTKDMNPEMKFI